jgi:hypothetical protein
VVICPLVCMAHYPVQLAWAGRHGAPWFPAPKRCGARNRNNPDNDNNLNNNRGVRVCVSHRWHPSLLRHPAASPVAPPAAEGAGRGVCSRASERDLVQAEGATVYLQPKNAPPRRAGNGDTRRECPAEWHHHENL